MHVDFLILFFLKELDMVSFGILCILIPKCLEKVPKKKMEGKVERERQT